ncbi:MAG TPA: hypothetical protein VGI46_00605 [Candidatus Acidoferrum sp.]|jgi:hypothetical protein
MGKLNLLLGLAALLLVIAISWQVVSAEISNAELRADMRDIAAQVATRIGLEPPNTDEQLRTAVLHKAEEHDISLTPEQVTVRQTGEGKSVVVFLSADYRSRINLLVYSFTLHFTPSSNK